MQIAIGYACGAKAVPVGPVLTYSVIFAVAAAEADSHHQTHQEQIQIITTVIGKAVTNALPIVSTSADSGFETARIPSLDITVAPSSPGPIAKVGCVWLIKR